MKGREGAAFALGLRITYLFDTSTASTDCDFAVPFAVFR